jgi:acyl-CoA thioester hydrolase
MSARPLPEPAELQMPDMEVSGTPLFESRGIVEPGWVGANGFMGVAYYVYAFDTLSPWVHRHVGLTRAYRSATQTSTFVLEANLVVEKPLRAGDPIRFTSQLLGFDAKRVQVISSIYHDAEGWLAATYEVIVLFVDMRARRSMAMPDWLQARFAAVLEAHSRQPTPPQVGRVVGLQHPPPF